MSTFTYHDAPAAPADALAALPAALAGWFRDRYGAPTPAQRLAWPALARGGHLLVSAPTGTGKTLAALLPIVGDLLTAPTSDSFSDSPLRAVYVAPLKALVNDAARTLEAQLADLATTLPPDARRPRLAVRTGDTAAADRRRLRDEPADLLLTTPESLAVLLAHGAAANTFANLAWLVIDEVHALAGSKRGCDMALSIERLTALSTRPVRRVGLSATATPVEAAARWLAGAAGCAIARAPGPAPPQVAVEPLPEGVRFVAALTDRLLRELPRHRALLVFTNTRALSERVAWAMRRRSPALDDQIAVHHSALAAGRRRAVEERFKNGELRAVVTSTSLELGIDIGRVDLAVLVHPPGDVVRLLQRVGRAGHEPGGVRRGLVLTASPAELLEAAVTVASGLWGQCEPLALPAAPLDVLCQHLLGMCCARSWPPDEMFDLVRRAAPYQGLSRQDFDDCLAYLCGAGGWLPARLREDGDCWRVGDARTARLLRRNLGTIIAERTVPVAVRREPAAEDELAAASYAAVGEIDEAFADRLQPGDRFLLDGKCLEYRARQEGAAVVEEVAGQPRVPRWGRDGWPLSPQLAHRLAALRAQAAEALRDGAAALARLLREDYALGEGAVSALVAHFQEQELVSEVPEPAALLVEIVHSGLFTEYYLHTPLNQPGNDALARVASARLARVHETSATSVVADLGFLLRVRGQLADAAEALRQALAAEGLVGELDAALAAGETLRARFVRVAQTGLMLLRHPERRRKVGGAGWGERRLFEQVRGHDADFVLLRQARRELREEVCDVPAARAYAEALPRLAVRCRHLREPSPFARAWSQAGPGEPVAAETPAEALARLHAELTGGGR